MSSTLSADFLSPKNRQTVTIVGGNFPVPVATQGEFLSAEIFATFTAYQTGNLVTVSIPEMSFTGSGVVGGMSSNITAYPPSPSGYTYIPMHMIVNGTHVTGALEIFGAIIPKFTFYPGVSIDHFDAVPCTIPACVIHYHMF